MVPKSRPGQLAMLQFTPCGTAQAVSPGGPVQMTHACMCSQLSPYLARVRSSRTARAQQTVDCPPASDLQGRVRQLAQLHFTLAYF